MRFLASIGVYSHFIITQNKCFVTTFLKYFTTPPILTIHSHLSHSIYANINANLWYNIRVIYQYFERRRHMPQTSVKQNTAPPPAPKKDKTDTSATPKLDEYYSSVSFGYRIAKYISIVLLVVFVIFSFTFLRKDITLENLRYLLKFISFTNTETSITAPKISYASGDPNRLDLFIGDLCTLSPSGYALYDSQGNQIMSEQINYASPVLKTNARFALCYDLDGSEFTILNTFTLLYEGTSEFPITDATIADDGSFAIASSSREYRTAITLYNSDFEAISRVYKNDHLMALEYMPDASKVAVMTAGAENGEFYTKIELVVPGETSPTSSAVIDGLGYSLYYLTDGIAVVTDEGVCFFDGELNLRASTQHTTQLAMTDASDKYLVVVYSDGVIGKSYTMRVFDVNGRIAYEGEFSGKLVGTDSDDSGDYIFILTGNELSRINLINKKIGTLTVEADAIDLLVSDPETVLVALKNYALTYSLTGFEEHYYDRASGDLE